MRSIGEEFLSGFFNAPWYFRRVRVLCGSVWQVGYFVTWQTGNASISVGRLCWIVLETVSKAVLTGMGSGRLF